MRFKQSQVVWTNLIKHSPAAKATIDQKCRFFRGVFRRGFVNARAAGDPTLAIFDVVVKPRSRQVGNLLRRSGRQGAPGRGRWVISESFFADLKLVILGLFSVLEWARL